MGETGGWCSDKTGWLGVAAMVRVYLLTQLEKTLGCWGMELDGEKMVNQPEKR